MTGTLTEEQRRLVEENVPLVAVHLRRHVPGLRRPRRNREWEDLFQEGCLGLAAAAASYDPGSGMAFAAYALPRIQSAVNLALRRGFETVRLPERSRGDPRGPDVCGHVVSLDFEPPPSRHRPDPPADDDAGDETIGDRVREKYDQAVRQALMVCKSGRAVREDRSMLLDRLADERLFVPEAERRIALRQIARETGSSYARVAYAEKRLIEQVRATLSQDGEFARLLSEARRRRTGLDSRLAAKIGSKPARNAIGEFERLYRTWSEARRAGVLWKLLKLCGIDPRRIARALFGRISPEQRRRLLAQDPPGESDDSPAPSRVTGKRSSGRSSSTFLGPMP